MLRSDAAAAAKITFPILGGKKYTLYALFTTIDGHWYTEDNRFSIPEWAISMYGRASFQERGGAQHIFVRVEKKDGTAVPTTVVFRNADNSYSLNTGDKPSGWQNLPIYDGYNPDTGGHGGWSVYVDGADLGVTGIGLPFNFHISTFIVFQVADEDTTTEPVDTDPVVQDLVITVPTILRITANAPLTIEVNK